MMAELDGLTTEQAENLLERTWPDKSPEVRWAIVTLIHELAISGTPNGNAYSLGPSYDGRYITVEVRYEDARNVVEMAAQWQKENELLRAIAELSEWADEYDEDGYLTGSFCKLCGFSEDDGHRDDCHYTAARVAGCLSEEAPRDR